MLRYQDKGLVPGSSHTYTYRASDGDPQHRRSRRFGAGDGGIDQPALTYQATVLADNPSFLWPLNDTGSTAADASANGFNGTYESGTTQGQPGPFSGTTATGFDGNSGLVTAQNQVAGPQQFSVEGWFKTSTNTGGKLIGFGGNQTGLQLQLRPAHLHDERRPAGVRHLEQPDRDHRDAQRLQRRRLALRGGDVRRQANMALYVDGQLIGTNTSSSAQGYSGYWRVGGDNLNGWNLDPWGSNSQGTTQPHSYYFNGTIADVAVYPGALSAAQVAAHYAAGLNQE